MTEKHDERLVYIGKIINFEPIPNADFIVSATVVCGPGGKWRGVVRKDDFNLDDLCVVYLPDSLVLPSDHMRFLESSNWRVKMRRFKGAPSEVVIMPLSYAQPLSIIGDDVTKYFGVTKYVKFIPLDMQGKVIGAFPTFIPKTDELHYQTAADQVVCLRGKPYYITEKLDGSSTTAYKYDGHFGVCSRNWELEKDDNNAYWSVALKYNLEEALPDYIAIQWETCGPKIQGNPLKLKEVDGFIFSAYNILLHRYLDIGEMALLQTKLNGMKFVKFLGAGIKFDHDDLDKLAEGKYDSGHQREGIVIRSSENVYGHKPISFKVINLNYET